MSPSEVELAAPLSSELQRYARGEVEIIQASVNIPQHLQYAIPSRKKGDDGQWRTEYKVGLTADGYDHVNRVMGVQLYAPRFVNDERGNEVLNPIHRKDYVYLRLVGVWWSDLGQMVAYGEDIEVDFLRLYHEARLNATWYERDPDNPKGKDIKHSAELKIARDPDGIPILDAEGMPKHTVIIPDSEELKAMQKLYNLRNFGLRYAYTVAKTRILKVASGIRQLPIDEPKNVRVNVYGYRDMLTPEQRLERAQRDQTAIFGKAITTGDRESLALNDREMETVAIEQAADDAPGAVEVEDFTGEEVADILAGLES